MLDALDEALSTMKDAETGERGYIITGEDAYLEPYNSAVANIQKQINRAKSLTADDPRQQANFPELQDLVRIRLDALDRTIALRRNDAEAARLAVLTGGGKQKMDAIRSYVSEMKQLELSFLNDRERQSSRSYHIAISTGLLTGAPVRGPSGRCDLFTAKESAGSRRCSHRSAGAARVVPHHTR